MKIKFTYLLIVFIVFAVCFINTQLGYAQTGAENIKLNQLGFYPVGPKVAVITAVQEPGQNFYILKANVNDTVYRGKLSAVMQSANSSTKTQIADFSKYAKNGSYVIYVPNVGTSYPF